MRGEPKGSQNSRRLTIVSALTAGLFLGYLIALSPHLVHHLFEEGHGHPDCPLLAQSQQTSTLQAADPPTLTSPAPIEVPSAPLPKALLTAPDLPVTHSRAPPLSLPPA